MRIPFRLLAALAALFATTVARTATQATKGAPAAEENAFIDFVLSMQGQAIVANENPIPLK